MNLLNSQKNLVVHKKSFQVQHMPPESYTQVWRQLGGHQLHLLPGQVQLRQQGRVLLRLRSLDTLHRPWIHIKSLVRRPPYSSYIYSNLDLHSRYQESYEHVFPVCRWLYGTNYCTRLPRQFLNSISSLRFTGAPDDMHFDTINFYTGEQVFRGKRHTGNQA